jgi:hypothetical protein
MKWILITFVGLIATYPAQGQGEKSGSMEAHREKFEEGLRWKLSAGDPSGDTQIEISGNELKITLTGNKSWNVATAALDAKYFGLLCLLWDTQAREEDQGEYVLRDSFDVTLLQKTDQIVARERVNRADFPTLADLNNAILLTKSQVRDILKGQAIQSNARPEQR